MMIGTSLSASSSRGSWPFSLYYTGTPYGNHETDGCSYDIQIMNVNYNPINREAMQSVANAALNYANDYIESLYGIENYNDTEVISEYLDYLSSASTCYLADDNSLIILNEELQPYYEGQKSIDEVIAVSEDRINTMMDETM